MLRIKIIEGALRPTGIKSLLKRCATTHVKKTSKDTEKDEDELNAPIPYSTSKAATWPANGLTFDGPQYQGMIVSLSIVAFLLYFCVLREENDIDEKIKGNMDPEVQEFLYGIKKNESKARKEYTKLY